MILTRGLQVDIYRSELTGQQGKFVFANGSWLSHIKVQDSSVFTGVEPIH